MLGGNYHGHYKAGPRVTLSVAEGAKSHPILEGVDVSQLFSEGSLYRCSPLAPATTPLLFGAIPDQAPEPVAWTHRYGPNRAPVFYTSLGHPNDFKQAGFRRLLHNAMDWALGEALDKARRSAPATGG